MNFLHGIGDWLIGFFGLHELIKTLSSGDYSSFKSLNGIFSIIRPIFPSLVFLELGAVLLYRKFKVLDYKIPLYSLILNAIVGRFISIAAVVFCIGLFEPYAILKSSVTWYWFIYGYVIWELGHFVYHYLGHKVRVLWCLHSTHHAPQTMNLSISFAHFFLEAPYADFVRTTVCILLGVNPTLLFIIMFIDGVWGGFIHIGEHMIKEGRLGFLNKYILTPSHHRVHHAKNPLYMDTNFCNLLNIWDRLFGTYQKEEKTVPMEYGITRAMRPNSFVDAYFGEIGCLVKDIRHAPGIKNKLLYIIMPPGWSHTGEHKTAVMVRKEFIEQNNYSASSKNKSSGVSLASSSIPDEPISVE